MRVACVQLTTGRNPTENLEMIAARMAEAVDKGAEMVALPETCNFMEKGRKAMQARVQPEADDTSVAAMGDKARQHNIWLLAGSLVLASEDGRGVNRSLLFAPDGSVAARYDKLHMFDVTLESGETHAESASYAPGERLVVADLGVAKLGMSICYDVRFAALYRQLALAGADIISVPSAFTQPTGAAHWHVLLRARAIETGCFILAPAQSGTHENGRTTYGHSLIISPWGKVLADAGKDDTMVLADLDLEEVAKARGQIPSLKHGRTFRLADGPQRSDD